MTDIVRVWPAIDEREGPFAAAFDAFNMVFFLDVERCGADPSFLGDAVRIFEELAPGELRYEIDEEGEIRELSDRDASLHASALGPVEEGRVAELRWFGPSSDPSAEARRFDAHFLHNPTADRAKYPKKRSVLSFRITHGAFVHQGPAQVVSIFTALAEVLPWTYGYASPGLQCDNFFSRAYKYIDRYPGFDVVNPFAVAWDLGSKLLGPYWLNLLSHEQVTLLGGEPSLAAKLPEACRLLPMMPSGVCLQLGDLPDVGDLNKGNALPEYRLLAGIVRDLLYVAGKVQYFQAGANREPRDAQEAWHRRFLA